MKFWGRTSEMKKFSKEEIDNGRKYCRDKRFTELEVSVGGRNINYFVVPSSVNPDLPNFVFRMTGDPKEGYILGVDEGMSEELRPYALFEEYVEFLEKGIDAKGRVVEAEAEAISLIRDESLKERYVLMRREFFTKMLEENEKHPEKYLFTEADVVEFKKNLSMLDEILGETD